MDSQSTRFGSLKDFQKGGVEIIDDDPKNYVFSNVFEVASKAKPYEKVAVGKNMQYVLEVLRGEGFAVGPDLNNLVHRDYASVLRDIAEPSAAINPDAVGYTVTTTADADEAINKTPDNHLVILDVVTGPRSAAELCREIRNTATMAAIPVLCIGQSDDVEERIRFLEAGADDVIAKPFDPRELEARVEALLLRFQRSKDLAPVISAEMMR